MIIHLSKSAFFEQFIVSKLVDNKGSPNALENSHKQISSWQGITSTMNSQCSRNKSNDEHQGKPTLAEKISVMELRGLSVFFGDKFVAPND